MLPKSLSQLAERFSALPGIGPKSALRLAVYCLSLEDKVLHEFAKSLDSIKSQVNYCQTCGGFADGDECSYCRAADRNSQQILVVESPLDVSVFIPTDYKGKFHVLGGLIAPLSGVGPDKLNIDNLIARVKLQLEQKNEISEAVETTGATRTADTTRVADSSEPVNTVEVILACPTSLEGEATSVYISQKLVQLTQNDGVNLKVTRLGTGMPSNSTVEYQDPRTLTFSLQNRIEL